MKQFPDGVSSGCETTALGTHDPTTHILHSLVQPQLRTERREGERERERGRERERERGRGRERKRERGKGAGESEG